MLVYMSSFYVVVNYLVKGYKWVQFSEIAIIGRLILVMLATNAVSERFCSNLWRLKNYLKSRMTQQWLNKLLILHTNKEEIDRLDLVAVANELEQKKRMHVSKMSQWAFFEIMTIGFCFRHYFLTPPPPPT